MPERRLRNEISFRQFFVRIRPSDIPRRIPCGPRWSSAQTGVERFHISSAPTDIERFRVDWFATIAAFLAASIAQGHSLPRAPLPEQTLPPFVSLPALVNLRPLLHRRHFISRPLYVPTQRGKVEHLAEFQRLPFGKIQLSTCGATTGLSFCSIRLFPPVPAPATAGPRPLISRERLLISEIGAFPRTKSRHPRNPRQLFRHRSVALVTLRRNFQVQLTPATCFSHALSSSSFLTARYVHLDIGRALTLYDV